MLPTTGVVVAVDEEEFAATTRARCATRFSLQGGEQSRQALLDEMVADRCASST